MRCKISASVFGLFILFLLFIQVPGYSKDPYCVYLYWEHNRVIPAGQSELHMTLENKGEYSITHVTLSLQVDSLFELSLNPAKIKELQPGVQRDITLNVLAPQSVFRKDLEFEIAIKSDEYEKTEKVALSVEGRKEFWTFFAMILSAILIFIFVLIYIITHKKENSLLRGANT